MAKIPDGTKINSKEKPDIIFCDAHSKNVVYILMEKFRKFWFDVPIVLSHLWFPDRRVLPLYYMVDGHITSCHFGFNYLKKMSGLNSKIIYLPVDTELFKPKSITKKQKIATIIGKNFKERSGKATIFTKSKAMMGTEYLFEIFNIVHKMDPEIKFVVNGHNPGLEVPAFVKKQFFSGDYKKGLYNIISKSSCVFFTTTWNMIPHSLTNAMSAEKIPVVWDLPAYHELMKNGESGFLVKPFNSESFAEKIVEVCNFPSKKMGKNARKSIVEKFERNMSAQKYLDYFETII